MKIIKTAHIREVYKKIPDASHSKLAEELDKIAKKAICDAIDESAEQATTKQTVETLTTTGGLRYLKKTYVVDKDSILTLKEKYQ